MCNTSLTFLLFSDFPFTIFSNSTYKTKLFQVVISVGICAFLFQGLHGRFNGEDN